MIPTEERSLQTEDLIASLARDLRPVPSLRRVFGGGTAVGVLAAGLLFAVLLGVRPDLGQALETVRFDFKFVVTLALAASALGLLFPLSRPGADVGVWPWGLAAVPAVLAVAVLAELAVMPEATWGARLIGTNARACLASIPVLSLGPLACLLACLRFGAPMRPGLTGAVAGLAASGIGATFYASHCPDDSPLFVMTWYVIATALVTLVGGLAGRILLKW